MALPTCHHCQEPIEQAQLLRVGPHRFHPDHFVCSVCQTPLLDENKANKKFHYKDGNFYCVADFQSQFGKKCHKCGESIPPGHVIQAFGKLFHPEHFCCEVCNASFENGSYYELDGAAYCAEHYLAAVNSAAAGGAAGGSSGICHTCSRPVPAAEAVWVQSNVFHAVGCLFCAACGCQLESPDGDGGGNTFQHDGEVYCRQDYLVLFAPHCAKCGSYIPDNCITANDENYHRRGCFECSVCARPLDNYIRVGGYLRCEEHVKEPAPPPDCDLCGQPIRRDVVLACGQRRHAQGCFECADCSAPLHKSDVRCRPGAAGAAPGRDLLCRVCFDRAVGGKLLRTSFPSSSPSSAGGGGGPLVAASQASPASLPSAASAAPSPEDDSEGPLPGQFRSSLASRAADQPPLEHPQTVSPPLPPPPQQPPQTAAAADGKPSSPQPSDTPAGAAGDSPAASVPPPGAGAPEEEKQPPPSEAPAGAQPAPGGDGSQPAGLLSKPSTISWKRGDEIGRGAFGRVYMALIEDTGELIAVKQVKLSKYDDNMQLILSMEHEIALMETLRHPNIVHLLGTQRKGNKFNILMEYIPGNSLDKILSKFGSFSEKVIKSYTAQLLSALAYCHASNIVHRDIKAKNILVDTKGTLKLADFGSAKRFEHVMGKAAPSLGYNYTPLWTAPEVLTGRYDSKVDIWSLGCVIVEMGTGQPPWSECKFENPFRALYHIGNSNTIPKLPKKLSPLGIEFLKLCLTRDPERRPSAAELLKHPWILGGEAEAEAAAAAAAAAVSAENGVSAASAAAAESPEAAEPQQ